MKQALIPICVVAFMVSGCSNKRRESAATAPVKDAQTDTIHDHKISAPMARAKAIWTQIQIKQNCNLLTGCPLADELVSLGTRVRVHAAEKLVGLKNTPHWRIAVLRSLRMARDRRIQEIQHILLRDKSWIIRSYAAVGLGYARDPEFRENAKKFLQSERHPGLRTALLWACSIHPDLGCREELVKHIKNTPYTQDIRIHLLALDAIRELRLVESLPTVRVWISHPNLFVRRNAVRTAGALLDRPSIPTLIQLLGQEETRLKTEILDLLRKFTGLKHARNKEAFVQWCARYCSETWPGRSQIND